jgi:hypothetical protein
MERVSGSYDQMIGMDAHARNGDKIGPVKDIFYDDVSGRPEWVSVRTGVLGGQHLAPIAGARLEYDDDDEGRLVLAYDESVIKDAPDVHEDEHLTPEDERTLYAHYGFDYENRSASDFGYGRHTFHEARFDKDWDRSKFGAIGKVGTEDRGTVEAETTIRNQEAKVVEHPQTVRLRKYQHTEMVPVTKEEVRVETTDDDRPGRIG